MSILEVKNIGKVYRQYSSEYKRVAALFGLGAKPTSQTWVLKNVSFSVGKGEAVAIVGENGSGKSTLLKIITGTVAPSEGSVVVHGKVAAILELGMGFNPEFTGRQNAYHSASLMGYSKEQIDGVMDEIEAFAEIGDYFDRPIKMYSSGMQMRVAFAVATAFRPELLIVDEALSVGDTYFQHKSFERIRQFQKAGTSLLFVSHDSGAIQAICDRAILLENGCIAKDATPQETMDYYNALIAKKENSFLSTKTKEDGKIQTISGTGELYIDYVRLLDENGTQTDTIFVGQKAKFEVRVVARQSVKTLVLGYMIKDRLGQPIFGTNTFYTDQICYDIKTGDVLVYEIAFNAALGEGSYSLTLALTDTYTHLSANYEWRDFALVFKIINTNKPYFIGTSWLPPTIKINRNTL